MGFVQKDTNNKKSQVIGGFSYLIPEGEIRTYLADRLYRIGQKFYSNDYYSFFYAKRAN
ncbi:hypothetical protein GCM10028807_31140 [Spirosoma daeguense]